MIDQRPIKPDKKYLEDYIERISKVEKKEYLKKGTSPILPCHAHHQIQKEDISPKSLDKRSKAEIYEEIKKKNRKRFGQKKIEVVQEEKIKKIDPKKMTVSSKPKTNKAKIDVEEYKKQGFIKKTVDPSKKEASDKLEYEKLLDYFKRELSAFEQEKQQFQKVANKLKFKDLIKKQEGLSYSKIKSQVENNLLTQNLSVKSHQMETRSIKECRSDLGSKETSNKLKTIRQCNRQAGKSFKPFSKTFSIGDIRACMKETDVKMKELKQNILHPDIEVNQHRYDISQIYLLPEFTPQSIYDYIDPYKLKYSENDLYKEAIRVFNAKFNKENFEEEENVEQSKQQQIKDEAHMKVKYIGEKRVMKYGGWTEVWIPGKQRLFTNNKGYKVVWLSNGDVLQKFSNKITTYYSKCKQILKINFNNLSPIYYHDDFKQLWRLLDDNKREVIFSNGRKQIVQQKIQSLV